VPQFATHPPWRAGRLFLWAVLGAAATLGLIFGAVKTRDMWMPKFVSAARPQPPQPPPSLGLRTTDHDGQLEIFWDRYPAGIRQDASARLEIIDGGSPQIIPLDAAHLQAGVFTYGRQSEKVDVKLVVSPAQGNTASEVTSFFGKLPERKPPPESEESKKQREELAAQAAKLKTDLNNQAARTRRLEKDLQEMKRRMLNQSQGKN
jgi:hypothetical protein